MLTIRLDSRGVQKEYLVPAAPEKLTVGSAAGAGIVLRDPKVDPNHLEIEMTPAGVRVTDLGTEHGTRLNGLLVNQGLLKPGDVLRVGASSLSLVDEMVDTAPISIPGVTPAAPPKPPKPATPPKPGGRPSSPKLPPRAASTKEPAAKLPPASRYKDPKAVQVEAPAPRVSARTPRKKRSIWPIVVGCVVIVAFAALLLLSSGKGEMLEKAKAAFDRAEVTFAAGRLDDAEKEFQEVVDQYPEAPQADRALARMEEIRDKRAEIAKARREREKRERGARRARDELQAKVRIISPDAFEAAWHAFSQKYKGTDAAGDPEFLEGVHAEYEAAGKERLDAVRTRVRTLVKAKRYYDARFALREYLHLPSPIPPDLDAAQAEDKRVREETRSAFDLLENEAKNHMDAGRMADAAALLLARRDAFRNTRHAIAIRQRLELCRILGRDTGIRPEAAAAEVAKREAYLRAAEQAEELARRRAWSKAVAAFRKAAEDCPMADLKAEFHARADQLADTAALFDELITQVKTKPERFRSIRLAPGLKGSAVAADERKLTLDLGGARSQLPWERLGPESLLTLLTRLELDPAGRIRLARFSLEVGDEGVAHEAITAALKVDPTLEKKAFEVLAQARGIAVPDGGFVLFRKRWMTPDERTAEELRAEIADAEKGAKSSDARKSEAGLAKLRDLGDPAKSALVRALGVIRENTLEQLLKKPSIRDTAVKGALYKELEVRRKAALELIFDTKKYPYPHPPGPAYDNVQKEVDVLVGRVREIWETPLKAILEKNEEIAALHDRIEAVSLEHRRHGGTPKESFADIVKRINAAINMPRFTPDGTSKGNLEWSDKCLEYNKKVKIDADEQERACVDTLNQYRMMMGRRAVKWNANLLKAGRGHSKEMKEKNFFAHNVPLPGKEYDDHRTPGQRAKNAGYGGGVSENIARGSEDGAATHWQWYRSSGHHRNLLGRGHTEVGVGRFHEFWTQNFGRASSNLDLPR